MKSNLFKLSFAFILFLSTTSCQKEGAQGPAGPAGPAGSANVKSVSFENQSFFFNPLTNKYQINLTVSDITGDIFNNGSVSAYLGSVDDPSTGWTALPGNFTPDYSTDSLTHFYDFVWSTGSVSILTNDNPGYNVNVHVVIANSN